MWPFSWLSKSSREKTDVETTDNVEPALSEIRTMRAEWSQQEKYIRQLEDERNVLQEDLHEVRAHSEEQAKIDTLEKKVKSLTDRSQSLWSLLKETIRRKQNVIQIKEDRLDRVETHLEAARDERDALRTKLAEGISEPTLREHNLKEPSAMDVGDVRVLQIRYVNLLERRDQRNSSYGNPFSEPRQDSKKLDKKVSGLRQEVKRRKKRLEHQKKRSDILRGKIEDLREQLENTQKHTEDVWELLKDTLRQRRRSQKTSIRRQKSALSLRGKLGAATRARNTERRRSEKLREELIKSRRQTADKGDGEASRSNALWELLKQALRSKRSSQTVLQRKVNQLHGKIGALTRSQYHLRDRVERLTDEHHEPPISSVERSYESPSGLLEEKDLRELARISPSTWRTAREWVAFGREYDLLSIAGYHMLFPSRSTGQRLSFNEGCQVRVGGRVYVLCKRRFEADPQKHEYGVFWVEDLD